MSILNCEFNYNSEFPESIQVQTRTPISLDKSGEANPSIHEVYKGILFNRKRTKVQKIRKTRRKKKQTILGCYPCVNGVGQNLFQLYMIYACLINLIGLKSLENGI